MQSSKSSTVKNRITQAIFTGAVIMLVVFAASLFVAKEWLVSGRIVVFPSGQPASASANLLLETGNTAEIIKSESFQKAYFPDQVASFASAKALKGSSVVQVKFRSRESDLQAYEDLIVKIPGEVDEYARDLYGGAPFKYKMAGDPEISRSPVRPNLLLNAILGFLGGILLYLIYWLGFGFGFSMSEKNETEKDELVIVSPQIKQSEPVEEKKEETAKEKTKPSAPENLPFVEEPASPASDKKIEEPSDEEVKNRLNRLMRGEL